MVFQKTLIFKNDRFSKSIIFIKFYVLLMIVNDDPLLTTDNGKPSLTIVNNKPLLTIVNNDPSLTIVNDKPSLTIVNNNLFVNDRKRREETDLKGIYTYH